MMQTKPINTDLAFLLAALVVLGVLYALNVKAGRSGSDVLVMMSMVVGGMVGIARNDGKQTNVTADVALTKE